MVVIQISILKKEKDLMIFKQHTLREETLKTLETGKFLNYTTVKQ